MRVLQALARFAILLGVWVASAPAVPQECTPDLTNWTATPTLRWNAAEGPAPVDGYCLYWGWSPGPPYCCHACFDCQTIMVEPEEGEPWSYRICPGVDYPFNPERIGDYPDCAPQKFTNTELETLYFAVKAYNEGGLSDEYSNEIPICMPRLRRYSQRRRKRRSRETGSQAPHRVRTQVPR